MARTGTRCEIGGSYSELDEVWDITPCRQVKLPMFRRSLLPPPPGSRNPRRDTAFVRNVGKCLYQSTERNLPTRRQTLERKYSCCKRVCVGCRLKVATGTWNTVYLKSAVTWYDRFLLGYVFFFRYSHCQSRSSSLCRSTSLQRHLVKYDTPSYHKTTMMAEHTACRFFLFCYFMCYRNYIVTHKFQTEIQRRNLMFMGPCGIVIIFWYIIPTRCTSHRVYLTL